MSAIDKLRSLAESREPGVTPITYGLTYGDAREAIAEVAALRARIAELEAVREVSSAQRPHKCPVCDGTGLVSKPPGVAGDQSTWSSGSGAVGPYTCHVCKGEGVLWR